MKTWDELFAEAAVLWASKSKDTTQVGCVIVDSNNIPRMAGFNGIPRGVEDKPERLERPEKYKWICHSETNAIANAARIGVPLEGTTMYVTGTPCNECAKVIIGAGIKKVVCSPKSFSMSWDTTIVDTMFKEAGIEYIKMGE